MRPQTIVKQLPVKLTGEEKLLKSDQRTAVTQDVMELEEQLKANADNYKTQIKEKQNVLLALHRELRSGEEIRPIECVEVPRWEQDMVEVVRNDTGEVVERRAMDPRDKQSHLSLGDFDAAREKRRSKAEKAPPMGKLTLIEGENTEGTTDPEETH